MSRKHSNGEILNAILDMKTCIGKVDSKVGIAINKMKIVEQLVTKHEKVLYGNPEKMGEGGLLFKQGLQDKKIYGLGKSIDNTRSTFVMIWTGIFAFIQLAFAGIKHFFSGNS